MRLHAYGLSLALLVAVASPLRLDPQDPSQDSFPLSTYPMFSYDRGRMFELTVAVARGERGFSRPVPPSFVASAETMHAQKTIMKAVRRGQARELCQAIAERVAQAPAGATADLRPASAVAIEASQIDVIAFVGGDRRPRRSKALARCPIPWSHP